MTVTRLHPHADALERSMRPWLYVEPAPEPPTIRPASSSERSRNPLRPHALDDIVGQDLAKRTIRQVMHKTAQRGQPFPHTMLVGAAGTGKSTFATVIGNELGLDVYTVGAPVSFDVLFELREAMNPHDILFVDEIHLQTLGDRRGRSSDTTPEQFYHLLEDRVLMTPTGPLPFPAITVIGATTDEGMLPDSFIRRFTLRPHLEPYTHADMLRIAGMNAQQLGVTVTPKAADRFARASRRLPWQMNTFMESGVLFAPGDRVTVPVTREVLRSMHVQPDGLTADMTDMLLFLYQRCRQQLASGEVRYQASVQSIATALGKSRDSKAVMLRVEPYLIQQGYVQVLPQGRRLTDAGIARAQQLSGRKP